MSGLRITADGRVSVITVNRPEVLNALDTALLEELLATLADLARDETCGAIILTGAGDRSFIAGADIKEMDGKTPLEARAYSELGQEIAHKLETMRKPTLAAVNGYALGGGCELALACDVRLASTHAHFGQPEINLGILPGLGRHPTAGPRDQHRLRQGADPDRSHGGRRRGARAGAGAARVRSPRS